METNILFYSKVMVLAWREHLVATGSYLTHFPLCLYILSLNSSKGGARNIWHRLFLHTTLNKDANPNPSNIDIIIFPRSVCKNFPK